MDQGIMTLITVGIILAAAAGVLWLLYTVIWHGVRRGMLEFSHVQLAPSAPSAAWHHARRVPAGRVPAGGVPDYPPREWV